MKKAPFVHLFWSNNLTELNVTGLKTHRCHTDDQSFISKLNTQQVPEIIINVNLSCCVQHVSVC